ncbi:HIT-like protein [Saccharata proteae CBS 121410]|uniref:Aprataxin-like protein n=1 Tax=Saccharata proteae CBS 121410 TaxID=1314787 RepID=A0A9P4HW23_9PEZI|nr:HIT-like protein [Saccharata proteae CBS 121410]
MVDHRGINRDAVTEQEVASSSIPVTESGATKRPNAFTELMTRKHAKPSSDSITIKPSSKSHKSVTLGTKTFHGRDGLGAYIADPSSFPPSRILYHTKDWVVINDMFPKSSVHLLLLPRDPDKTHLHPFDAFEDAEFLQSCRAEAEKVVKIVAAELRRKYGRDSKQDRELNEAMDADEPPDPANLPKGRDWSEGVLVGIHSRPSMSNLHIHVLSPDRFSERLKHRKHYNSFSTPFLVPLDAFPLAKNDERRHPGRSGYLDSGFVCWRCGQGFGNQFKRLKEHLEEEFEAWRKE